jgi:hypothetical protein
MLFEIIPNAPWFDTDAVKPMTSPHDDGMIGSIGNAAVNQVVSQVGQMYM